MGLFDLVIGGLDKYAAPTPSVCFRGFDSCQFGVVFHHDCEDRPFVSFSIFVRILNVHFPLKLNSFQREKDVGTWSGKSS
jgi:hypothetical protein